MKKAYKHWTFWCTTPAGGMCYHHKVRNTIMTVYSDHIRLFREIAPNKDGELCSCNHTLPELNRCRRIKI